MRKLAWPATKQMMGEVISLPGSGMTPAEMFLPRFQDVVDVLAAHAGKSSLDPEPFHRHESAPVPVKRLSELALPHQGVALEDLGVRSHSRSVFPRVWSCRLVCQVGCAHTCGVKVGGSSEALPSHPPRSRTHAIAEEINAQATHLFLPSRLS